MLAHEYYGHAPNFEWYNRFNSDDNLFEADWFDEVRASLSAARYAPNLTDIERYGLVNEAIERAYNSPEVFVLPLDGFMREVLQNYGYADDDEIRFNERFYNNPDTMHRFAKRQGIRCDLSKVSSKNHGSGK